MIAVSALWNTWSGPVGAILGGAFTWTGTLIRSRLQMQRNKLDAGQQALRLVDQSQKQQAYLAAALERAIASECAARAREVATADMVQELHIQLVGARLRCHDVEMRFGLEPTLFPLVPAFPWKVALEGVEVSTERVDADAAVVEQSPSPPAH